VLSSCKVVQHSCKGKKDFTSCVNPVILRVVSRPLLRDVAALAQVSEPTVSRVLNGRTNVAAATRDKVTAALQQLGYTDVPEPKAVRRNVCGIVCGEFLNPVFPTLIHHISEALAREGFLTNVTVTDPNSAPEERCVRELRGSGVDGAIFVGGHHAEVDGDMSVYRFAAGEGLPMVLVNGGDTRLDVPHVYCDERIGAYKATTHLIELGHTRIGCVLGTDRFVPTGRMLSGYRSALADASLVPPAGAVTSVAFTLEGGRVGARKLLDAGFTGIIAGNDLMALGAIRAAASGVRDTGVVSVVGYDGTDFTSMSNPPLTTIRQPFEDMALHIASALVSEIDGSRRFRDHYVFEPELILRESTRPCAVSEAPLSG
jgi:DNA-binding LacI/PurR family transcriptional regulator